MKPAPLALLILLFSAVTCVRSQSFVNTVHDSNKFSISRTRTEGFQTEAREAISILRRLEQDVVAHRSLAEFESDPRWARVSLQTFERDLDQTTREIGPLLTQLPAGQLKNHLQNALASYLDGAFWWRKIDQPRVVHFSALNYESSNRTPADSALEATIPYTVVMNWRQAQKYLARAEASVNAAAPR